MKIKIKTLKGKEIKSNFEGIIKVTITKLIEIEIVNTIKWTKLFIKAPCSPLFFAKNVIYRIMKQ